MGGSELRLTDRKVTDAVRLVYIDKPPGRSEDKYEWQIDEQSCLQSPHVGDMCEMPVVKRRQDCSVKAVMFEGNVA